MFDFSPEKLLLVAAVALIFLGPKRLPGVARSVGRWLGDLRKATGGMAEELKTGLNDPATPTPAPTPGPSAPPTAPAAPATTAPAAPAVPAPTQAVETPPPPPGPTQSS